MPPSDASPLRFEIGQRVEVKISPGEAVGDGSIGMVSVLFCDTGGVGRWVSARVVSLHYRQSGWCPDFFCPCKRSDLI